ncbi:conserved hypothetical protein [Neospora caninum Liverpool]|uniref:Glucosidase 2 subunit beta-like domain-containing protein n=1 Tax=Neospora caninum (strain Liverpool) TaxID=572307 RepID=F0V984_NEOCL|nr:conserved hypothetical protein [Neospora caninum Liverpool]CBZ50309.1 conserved hypothetical protein [Neospora caninum Liverpool]CEL64915.1 TPA: hypothetical protein BN1204_007830 [Neospora caninum Liverpool]|eukprot:XP_003880343.1 conserved hypothetical protein [Neospora caninum Liverpool]
MTIPVPLSTTNRGRRGTGVARRRSCLSLLFLALCCFCVSETESTSRAPSTSRGTSQPAVQSAGLEKAESQTVGDSPKKFVSSTPPSPAPLPDEAPSTAHQTLSQRLASDVQTPENVEEGEASRGVRRGAEPKEGRQRENGGEQVERGGRGEVSETQTIRQTQTSEDKREKEEVGMDERRGVKDEEAYPIPRGVNPRFAAAYTPQFPPASSTAFLYRPAQLRRGARAGAFFKCPSTGLLIPWEMLNDNFCDCRGDGFDEPGTDACSGVAPVHTGAAERLRAALHAFIHSRKVTENSGYEEQREGRVEEEREGAQAKREMEREDKVCGAAGGCGDKVFGKLKGAAGFFCAGGQVHEGLGKLRVISPMKVHDGICDCCDGADERAGVSLLRVSAVAFRPFTPSFPFRKSPRPTACPNRCAEEKAQWEAAVRDQQGRLASARAQAAAQQQRVAQVVQRRANEKRRVEAEAARLQQVLDCMWMAREAKRRGEASAEPVGYVHHNAAFQRAVKREILAARDSEAGQALKAEAEAEAEAERRQLWCEQIVREVLEERQAAGVETLEEDDEDELSVTFGAQLSGPPAAFTRPEEVALFPPPRLQYDLRLEQGKQAASKAEEGGKNQEQRPQTEEEKHAAAVAEKAEASRHAALEAYLKQQSRGEGTDDEDAEGDEGASVSATLGAAWKRVWEGAKHVAQRGVRAIQRGLSWVGIGPTRKKKGLGSLQRSLEALKEKQTRLDIQLKNLEGVKALLAPLSSACLFTSDPRGRFDFQICLFDRVRQFFYRPRRAHEAMAAYQNHPRVEGESPDISRFTGGPPGEPQFTLGRFRSLEVVKCPKGAAAATHRLLGRKETRRAPAESRSEATEGKTDEATGFAFRPDDNAGGDDDEEDSAAVSQGGDHEFCFSMLFADGDACLNDVHRETEILIHCGPELFVVQVQEPVLCRYSVVLTTPLLCPREQLLQLEKERFAVYHDEL